MSHWREHLDPAAAGGRDLPWNEVARRTSLSRTTAWRLQKQDAFPAPYVISPGRVAYREEEVEAWRRSRDVRAGSSRAIQVPGPPPCETEAEPPSPALPLAVLSGPAGEAVDRPVGVEPASRRVRRGRRTAHAKAIAQQMLFDF